MRWLLLVGLVACQKAPAPVAADAPVAVAAPERFGAPWTHTLHADHDLVGRIWDVDAKAFVTPGDVDGRLAAADWRFLGEKHDNADHHRLQAERITALKPAGVVFEHLDDGDAIGTPATPSDLAASVGWADSGWPEFAIYEPVFAATMASGAAILAGHPTNDQLRSVSRAGGYDVLGDAATGLPLHRELDEAGKASLSQEIVDAHCGHANEQMVASMIRLQRMKDAWMARAMTRQGKGAVLVAGGGHTRADRGVPHYLDGTSAVVLFREVDADTPDPAAYDDEGADFLWFTPRVDDADPCEEFRKSLEAMGKPAAE